MGKTLLTMHSIPKHQEKKLYFYQNKSRDMTGIQCRALPQGFCTPESSSDLCTHMYHSGSSAQMVNTGKKWTLVKFRLWVQIVQESCSICSFDMPTVIFTLTMNWLWLLPVPLYNSTWMETTKMVWMEFVLHHRGYLQFNKHLS